MTTSKFLNQIENIRIEADEGEGSEYKKACMKTLMTVRQERFVLIL